MADTFGKIDIEGRTLTCNHSDVQKLQTSDGSYLEMVKDRVHTLDEGNSDEEFDAFDEEDDCVTQEAKIERMKREYISVLLNPDRDPIKCGAERKFPSDTTLYDDEDELNGNMDNRYRGILKKYRGMTGYEQIIADPENKYESLSSGQVFKRRICTGVGPLVGENTIVIYNCSLWTEGSTDPFDSTWLRRKVLINDLSVDHILPGLRELLLTMRKGEWCEAFLQPEAAFGVLGAMPRIPPRATIFCLVEMVKVIEKDKIDALVRDPNGAQNSGTSFNDLYAASDEARMRGNYFYDQKQYRAALQRYKSGIRILEVLTYKNEEDEKKGQALLVKLFNNSARAANASGDPRLALAACKQAQLIDEFCPKTHWNRVVAWRFKGHPDKALGAARRAMQLFPENTQARTYKTFQKEVNALLKQIKNETEEVNNLYKLMGKSLLTN